MDCQAIEMDQPVALAQRRGAWNALDKQLYAETDCYRTIGPPGSEMELIHTGQFKCFYFEMVQFYKL